VKVNLSATITPSRLTVGALREALTEVPDEATVRCEKHKGDYNQSDYYSLTFSWTEER
jgi:hypothetical protein